MGGVGGGAIGGKYRGVKTVHAQCDMGGEGGGRQYTFPIILSLCNK